MHDETDPAPSERRLAAPRREGPLGGQRTTRSGEAWGPYPAPRRLPRATSWLLAAAALLGLIAALSPAQLPVVLYKTALIALAAVLGYWLDRMLFPYARPDGYLERDWRGGTDQPEYCADYPIVRDHHWVFAAALLRRAIIVGAVVLGVAMGM